MPNKIGCVPVSTLERILRHCGLWQVALRTLASARGPRARPSQILEPWCVLELVLDPELVAAESGQSDTHRSRGLQLVLDAEFLEARPADFRSFAGAMRS